jgi:putative SOS response-associated peptidase YedK
MPVILDHTAFDAWLDPGKVRLSKRRKLGDTLDDATCAAAAHV